MTIRREDFTSRLDYLEACKEAGEVPETPSSFLTISAGSLSSKSSLVGSPPEHLSVAPIPVTFERDETRFGYKLSEIMAQLQAHTDGGDMWFTDQGEEALKRKGFVAKLMTTAPRPPKTKKRSGKLEYVPGSYLVDVRNVCCEPDCRVEFIPVAVVYGVTNRCEVCLAKIRKSE
jgi:hypothetical protein